MVLLFANLVELVAMPALAGLVIVAGVQMVNVNAIQTVWQTNTVARTIMLITFGSTLVMPLQYAVFLGVADLDLAVRFPAVEYLAGRGMGYPGYWLAG